MKTLQIFALLCMGLLLNAREYAVVSSAPLGTLSKSQVKVLFLKKSLYIKDLKIVPLNLAIHHTIRKSFEQKVLHMSFLRLKSYWTKQHYLGKRPPINVKSPRSMEAYLLKIEGSIGYMQLSDADKKLNILYKWSD